MAVFSLSLKVVFPLFVYISIGILSGRTGFLRQETCREVNAFNVRVLFFLNMFKNVYSARDFASSSGIMYILIAAGYTAAVFVVLYLTVPPFLEGKGQSGVHCSGRIQRKRDLVCNPDR